MTIVHVIQNWFLGLVAVLLANPLAFIALVAVIVGAVALLDRSDHE